MATQRISLFRISITGILLLAGIAIANAQPAAPQPKPIGSISGHVIINGKAAAGITVGALGGENFNRRIPAAQTVTDSEGYYRLAGLAAGNYQITTFTANLTPAEPASDYPYGFPFGSSKGVLLAAGEEVNEIDIKLVRGGVITGRVTDAENKPLVEERVSLQPIQESGSRTNRPPFGVSQMYQTDDRGVYRIYGLPAGRYKVSVGGDASRGFMGGINGYFQLTYHPDVSDASRATIIDLAEGGQITNVDIRVGPYHETYSVTGRVVDAETGLPISGVRVGLMLSRDQQTSMITNFPTPTGPDGKFSQQGFTPGRYGVYIASDYGDSEFYSDPVFFDVAEKNVSGLEIRGIHGLSISGTLVAENMQLRDLLKQLPGLEVSAMTTPADGRMTPSTIRSSGRGVVGADGSFQVSGLRPGRVSLSVLVPNATKRVSILRISYGGIGLSQGFEIQPGQAVSGVQIAVVYGTGVIRGSVRFEGAPPPEILRTEVICYRQAPRSFAGGATLDARGHFLLNGFAPGAYECGLQYAFAPGTSRRMPATPQQTATVTNDAEAELNFVVDLRAKEGGP
jgi:5-hydroxyisourate hydrolase-like protein (transthyretin family)